MLTLAYSDEKQKEYAEDIFTDKRAKEIVLTFKESGIYFQVNDNKNVALFKGVIDNELFEHLCKMGYCARR